MQRPPKSWYVYMLRCGDGTIYTGIARDVAARIRAHASGRGARYTAGRGPFELCAKRRCRTQSEALRLEYAIKQLPRAVKLALAARVQWARFARSEVHAENSATSSPTGRSRCASSPTLIKPKLDSTDPRITIGRGTEPLFRAR